MKPTWRDVLLLVALQFAASLAVTLLLVALKINDGSNSWVGIVGAMMGAQVFAILREKKRPGLVPACAHPLALSSALFEVSLGTTVLLLLREAAGQPRLDLASIVFVMALTTLINYGLTRTGLRLGIRYVEKAAAERKAK